MTDNYRIVASLAFALIGLSCMSSIPARLKDADIDAYERVVVVGALTGITLICVGAVMFFWSVK